MDKIRIDLYLAQLGYTRSYAAKLIAAGRVCVNGAAISKTSAKIDGSEDISIEDFEPEEIDAQAEDITLDILYEDDDLIVINKPRGMVVHPSKGHLSGTLVNALLGRKGSLSSIGGKIRPGIVHRLDKDTSGLIVVAKNDDAHHALSCQIEARKAERSYYALVHGAVGDSGVVDANISRDKKNRLKMAVVGSNEGKAAVTHYSPVEVYRKFTLVEAKLVTGRTHQIRVHMAHIGHPVAGDPLYGRSGELRSGENKVFGGAQILHSRRISFKHPRTGEDITVESELPRYFVDALEYAKKV